MPGMILRRARQFRLLWVGQSISVIGDGMQRIALLWWAKLTGGNALLVAVALSTVIPVVVASPFGGWLADRYDRRILMVGADLLRALTTTALATLLITGGAPAVLICALVALSAVGTAVFDPSYAAAVPTVVQPADLASANGLNLANSAVGGLAGPLVGGILIGAAGVSTVIVLNALTFLWSAAFVAASRLPRPAGAADDDRSATSTRAAVQTVLGDRRLRQLVGLAAVLNMVVAPVPLLIVALAVDGLHIGSMAFGLLEVMFSVGLLVGALSAGVLVRGRVAVPMVVLGLCLTVAGLLPFVGSAAVFVVGGVAVAVANTALITIFQRSVPAEVQGRVFGVVGALGEGLRPAGLALGAPLLALMGVSGAFVTVGVGVVLATALWGRGLLVPGASPGLAAPAPQGDVTAAAAVAG